MRRIVFASTYSLAEPVLKNRLTPFIDLALDRGFSVVLVNPVGGDYHRAQERNFSHVVLDIPQANRGNFFIRTLRELLLARKVLAGIPGDSDVVFVTIPSMFLLFLFHGFGNSLKVLDVRDLTWEYLSDTSIVMRCAKAFFRFLARWKLPRFDFYCVTNSAERKYLVEEVQVVPEEIVRCSNGITIKQFQRLAQVDYDFSPEKPKRPCLTYIGNVGVAQNLITLVEAAKQLPDVDFRIVGGGSDQARIEDAARTAPNIEMTGRVDWTVIPAAYQQADVLWAQLTPEFSGAVPSKLYEYLATGKRVIYGGLGEAVSVISGFEDVEIVQPGNVPELVSAIRKATAPNERLQVNLSNRQKVKENYIREISVERFYQRICEG
jgi:glycosyltransferase involved in cell wall biosynthesis